MLIYRIVYTQDVAGELRARLEGKYKQVALDSEGSDQQDKRPVAQNGNNDMAGFKPSGFKSSFKPAAPIVEPAAEPDVGDLDGEQMGEDVDGELIGDEIDGEEMEDDDNVDGAPMDDLDGEEMGDVDGQSLDDDLDGEAI